MESVVELGLENNPLTTLDLSAQVTTYTYQPLVGMTSQTDVVGVTTYYKYDELQRLKRVRDQQATSSSTTSTITRGSSRNYLR
jgi:YD repeat-containing protein